MQEWYRHFLTYLCHIWSQMYDGTTLSITTHFRCSSVNMFKSPSSDFCCVWIYVKVQYYGYVKNMKFLVFEIFSVAANKESIFSEHTVSFETVSSPWRQWHQRDSRQSELPSTLHTRFSEVEQYVSMWCSHLFMQRKYIWCALVLTNPIHRTKSTLDHKVMNGRTLRNNIKRSFYSATRVFVEALNCIMHQKFCMPNLLNALTKSSICG